MSWDDDDERTRVAERPIAGLRVAEAPTGNLRKLAEKRADAKLAFRSHASVYGVVIFGLAILNVATSPDYLWFFWPMFGWGIGLALHGFAVHERGDDARERAIEEELERLRHER